MIKILFTIILFVTCSYSENIKTIKIVNGNMSTIFSFYMSNKDTLKDGKYIKKTNNSIIAKGSYKQGLKTGKWAFFYKSGIKKIEFNAKNGNIIGNKISWYQNGNIKSSEYYEKGVLHNESKFWYKNGNIKKTISYKYGYLNGKTILYFPNGQKKEILNYKISKKTGIHEKYDQNGNLIIKEKYN